MEFVFNGRALEYHDTVVFENVYTAKSGVADELIHVGKHEDMNDADQTVGFGEDDLYDEIIEETGARSNQLFTLLAIFVVGCSFASGMFYAKRRRDS